MRYLLISEELVPELLSAGLEEPILLFGRPPVAFFAVKPRCSLNYSGFSLDPVELVSVIREAESRGLKMLGIYHVHDGPPIPSPRDRFFMEIWRVFWLVRSSSTGSLKCWSVSGECRVGVV